MNQTAPKDRSKVGARSPAALLSPALAALLLAGCSGAGGDSAPADQASEAASAALPAVAGSETAAADDSAAPVASAVPPATPAAVPSAPAVPVPATPVAAAPAKPAAPAAPAVAAASVPAAAAAAPVAPPQAFATCRACHSVAPGKNGVGPTLFGIMGSQAGEVPGFNFSPALKGSGIKWTRASMDTWLAGPTKMVPGTRMVMSVSNPEARKAIIDYLETLK